MIRSVFNALGLGLITGVLSVVALPLAFVAPERVLTKIAQTWSKLVLLWCGVEATVEGQAHLEDGKSYLVMANHTSHFDALAIYGRVRWSMTPVAKRELGYIPIFGWALAAGAAVMIDRGDRVRAKRSIDKAARIIQAGRSVLLFPEGTRTAPGVVGPLKKGPFHLALAAGVPIVPIGVEGTGAVLAVGSWRIHPGAVHVRVGAPIPVPTEGDEDTRRAALMASVEAALRTLSNA